MIVRDSRFAQSPEMFPGYITSPRIVAFPARPSDQRDTPAARIDTPRVVLLRRQLSRFGVTESPAGETPPIIAIPDQPVALVDTPTGVLDTPTAIVDTPTAVSPDSVATGIPGLPTVSAARSFSKGKMFVTAGALVAIAWLLGR